MRKSAYIFISAAGIALVCFLIWAYRPAPGPVQFFTFPTTPEEGLIILVQDLNSKTLAGTYREGDMWVTFEVTRGEPNALRYRILNGGGPYETHGCFRSMFLQPIMTIDECVSRDMPYTEDTDADRSGESFLFITQAVNALSSANVPGLEQERDFLVEHGRPQLFQSFPEVTQ